MWLGLCAAVAGAQAPETLTPQWQRIELGNTPQHYPFAIYSNKPWGGDMRGVASAVLIFHGMGRNARGYFATGQKLLAASGANAEDTLLIAPQFFATADAGAPGVAGLPMWRGSAWNSGQDAANWPWPLSAFDPIDDLLAAFLDKTRFPQLTRIVLAGHSGGGQLVHRYAVLNSIDDTLRAAGKRVSYVIANPSSYLYFTAERPSSMSPSGFARYDAKVCPDYNQYRYGTEKLLRYAAKQDAAALFARYAARDVAYLLGSADNDPQHEQLDQNCGARAGGAHRLERGRNYIRYERHLAGANIKLNRRAYEVIGVGHTQSRMFGSQCGGALLFGVGEDRNVAGAGCRGL